MGRLVGSGKQTSTGKHSALRIALATWRVQAVGKPSALSFVIARFDKVLEPIVGWETLL